MTRKLLFASVAALVSGALLGCFDAIAPRSPHARGISLSIAPVFVGAGAQDGVPGDVDLIRITLHNPPQADTTLNIPVTPGQDSITITITVTLNSSTTDTVGVTFQAIRSSDGAVLYFGAQSYEVSAGVATSGSPFTVTYVGPGQNIRSIAITPTSATIKPGDSLTFGYLALDSTGATIVGMPVLYDSRGTGVVTVSAAGVAKGVALGSAYVVLTSGARAAVRDSALVTVANVAPPAIALSASAASFSDTLLTPDPASQVINVTNAGGGVLSGLSAGNIAYGAGGTGWLVATLAATTAPTTLTLAAAKGSLAAGTYTATVPVQSASAGNSPQNVSVTFVVAAAPTIVLSAATPSFSSTLLAADPAPDTISVTAAGGPLTNLTLGPTTYGASQPTGWLTASLSGAAAPAKLVLAVAKGSLAAGTYTATVPVQSASAGNSPQTVAVSFTVSAAPTMVLSATSVMFTDTLLAPNRPPDTITVTASGGTLANLTLGATSYGASQPTGWLTASLSGAAVPAKLVLTAAKGSLAAGTYTATVPVQSASAGNSPQSVSVTLVVVPAPMIGLSATSVTFSDTLLASDPPSQTVNVTASGGSLTNLTLGAVTYGASQPTGWLATASLSSASAPATLTLSVAKGSLAAGTYTATVPVQSASAGNSPQTVTVTFTIVAAPTIVPSSGMVTFNDTLLTSDPASQTVNVASAGGMLTGLSLGTISYGAGAGWLTTASLNVTTTPATLTLGVAKGSLAAGTYTATVPVQSALAGNSPQTVTVTFNIAPPPLVTLTAAPGYLVMSTGDMVRYAATGKDGSGNPATPFGLSYISRTPSVATVDPASGLVTAVASGTAVIVAQAPTATGTTADSTLIVIPGSGAAVVGAIGNGRAFDVAKTGDMVTVQVLVDLRGVPGDTLGSYDAQLNWSTAALTYVSSAPVTGGFAAPIVNETQTSTGQLRFSAADPSGSAGAFALIQVTFTAAAAGNSPLTLTLTDLSTAKTFIQLLPAAVIVSGSATVH